MEVKEAGEPEWVEGHFKHLSARVQHSLHPPGSYPYRAITRRSSSHTRQPGATVIWAHQPRNSGRRGVVGSGSTPPTHGGLQPTAPAPERGALLQLAGRRSRFSGGLLEGSQRARWSAVEREGVPLLGLR